jgi:hypothetical protein
LINVPIAPAPTSLTSTPISNIKKVKRVCNCF